MARAQDFQREQNGIRFEVGGMNTVLPPDLLPPGKYPYLQNVRSRVKGRITGRPTQGAPVQGAVGGAVHSLRRLNDSTPAGPPAGYVLVIGAAGTMYVNAASVATGFSGNPVSLVPFRPNTSVQPWMYVGDSSQATTVGGFAAAGMIKVRSDGLARKTGIKEPQTVPDISTATTKTSGTDALPADTPPWTNNGGANSAYNYGGTDAPSAVIIATPVAGATVTLAVTGTAHVNGATHAPGDAGPTASNFPGAFIAGAQIVVGAFTDSGGNIVATGALPVVVSIGASTTLTVPAGATQLQVGIDSQGGTFASNTGSYSIAWTVTTSAIATQISTLGNVTAYYWGDSPHSGPVAGYIWKNPNDPDGSGTPRSIGTAAGSTTNNSWSLDSTPEDGTVPVLWDTLASDGTVSGSLPLFTPALESEGYEDFNVCIVGNIFVPAPGTYNFTLQFKDGVLLGIGGGATWTGKGTIRGAGNAGQSMTVVNSLPLLPIPVPNGTGTFQTTTIPVTFPASGVYPIEGDWDYWQHTGRSFILQVNGATIPPLPTGVRTNVSYRYVYRASETGATSNPSPASTPASTPVLDNTVTPVFSPDPQVDKVDYYRQDAGLLNFTYVATGPNTNPPTPITDALSDTDAATNQLLQFDNFEPFPSIDLPRKGVVNVTGGAITWVSGDQFNTRWLPGTVILIGSPTSLAYSTIARPVSVTTMNIPGVPDGTNLAYEIAEPGLAAQPMASIWGPTDNVAYMFGCGDPLRPGTLYWTKGNNPDSAPDTNQQEVTSPSEPLMNGSITAGIGNVFSTERRWLIYPTFTSALATVSGVQGSAFNLILASSERGLYIRPAICTDGGNNTFFRAKDGIYMCAAGGADKEMTGEIWNLFPHEGFVPLPITTFGRTIFPPDDTQPELQKLAYANGYLYYDYVDTTGTPRTLVYGMEEKGWLTDVYAALVTTHALEEGPAVNGVLTGCNDGTIRALSGTGTEVIASVVQTPSVNGGDARANKQLGDIYVRGSAVSGNALVVALATSQYTVPLGGYAPNALAGTGSLESYIIDFTDGFGQQIDDIGMDISWVTGTADYIDLWQPDWVSQPESTEDRPTDWDDLGSPGTKFVQGCLLEADTFNLPKAIQVQRSDDLEFFTPNESPLTFNGQSIQPLTFTPPFIAHSLRIVTTDGVPWRLWGKGSWISEPFPEKVTEYQTEFTANGLTGWQHLREFNIAHISTTDLTLTLQFDQWPTIALTIPNSGGAQFKYKTPTLINKFKLVSYRVSSASGFYLFKDQCEAKIKPWGSTSGYSTIRPFGGMSGDGAVV